MARRRRSVRCASTVFAGTVGMLALAAAASGSPRGALAAKTLSFYSAATGVQYINTADDRARGAINNPFDSATNKLQPKGGETGDGPFAGDVAVYAFDLRPAPNATKSLGTASYTCYFNYDRKALCEAYYELAGGKGTVVASGPVDFSASGFELIVTGGTKDYLAAHGSVTAVPAAQGTQHVEIDLNESTGSGVGKRLVTYAEPSTVQFMNHADDRLRGMTANPFNVQQAGLVIVAKGKEQGNGPFPGDDVLYTFKLYPTARPSRETGTTVFTCYYDFVKHATCDAYLDLAGGLVLASGPVSFGSNDFTLAISGGTRAYAGASGEIVATASGKTERLDLRITR